MKSSQIFLLLESATTVCSVCVIEGPRILSVRESIDANKHSQFLAPFIDECLNSAGVTFADLSAIAVGSGPGSYTGLRVGASTAKGICFAQNLPLIGVDNLEALAWGTRKLSESKEDMIIPMIDARRMEVYMAMFDRDMKRLSENEPKILEEDMFDELIARGHRIIIVGNGTPKAMEMFNSRDQIQCEPQIISSAKQLIQPTLLSFAAQKFEDIYQFAPGYLKAPNITKSTKSIL